MSYIIIKIIINKYIWIYKLYFEFIMNNLNCYIKLFLIINIFSKKIEFNFKIKISDKKIKNKNVRFTGWRDWKPHPSIYILIYNIKIYMTIKLFYPDI